MIYMKKPDISILVPIYNAEKYLNECLDSLCGQTLKNLEILCINDGSTDGSLDIIKSYMQRHKNIRLLNKINTGYGDSMNIGIKNAKGAYIGIVEPDDYVNDKMFETLVDFARQFDADVVRGNYYLHSDKKDILYDSVKKNKTGVVVSPMDNLEIFNEPPAIWSSIYKKSFLEDEGIRFLGTPGAAFQDTSFNFKVLACAKRMIFTKASNIYYRVDNSGSSVKDKKKVYFVKKEYDEIEDFIEKLKDKSVLLKIMQSAKFGAYHWNLVRLSYGVGYQFAKMMKEEFSDAKSKGLIDRKYFSLKYYVSLTCLLIFPSWLYLLILKLSRIVLLKG